MSLTPENIVNLIKELFEKENVQIVFDRTVRVFLITGGISALGFLLAGRWGILAGSVIGGYVAYRLHDSMYISVAKLITDHLTTDHVKTLIEKIKELIPTKCPIMQAPEDEHLQKSILSVINRFIQRLALA